jgi:hypothetical protein
MEHYIPLNKDHSNFDEVLERFRDPDTRRELTENAYRDLIASGEHSYERFIARFDRELTEAGIAAPGSELADAGAIQRDLVKYPPHTVALRYLGGATFWLYRRYPRVWRFTVPPLRLAIFVLSRPIVWPVRGIARLLRRARSAPASP